MQVEATVMGFNATFNNISVIMQVEILAMIWYNFRRKVN